MSPAVSAPPAPSTAAVVPCALSCISAALPAGLHEGLSETCSPKRAVDVVGWVFFLISRVHLRVCPMGVYRKWKWAGGVELAPMGVGLNGL